jgi:hypothetical protein
MDCIPSSVVSYVCCILARYCIRWGRIYIDFDSIKRALKADALQIVNTVKKPAAAGAFEYDDSLANEVADGLPKYWPSVRIRLVDDSQGVLVDHKLAQMMDKYPCLT